MFDITELLKPAMGLQPIWYRVYYIIMCMHYNITTLFTGFLFQESFLTVCGQGYSVDESGDVNFNTIRQVEVLRFERSTDIMNTTHQWNI